MDSLHCLAGYCSRPPVLSRKLLYKTPSAFRTPRSLQSSCYLASSKARSYGPQKGLHCAPSLYDAPVAPSTTSRATRHSGSFGPDENPTRPHTTTAGMDMPPRRRYSEFPWKVSSKRLAASGGFLSPPHRSVGPVQRTLQNAPKDSTTRS